MRTQRETWWHGFFTGGLINFLLVLLFQVMEVGK